MNDALTVLIYAVIAIFLTKPVSLIIRNVIKRYSPETEQAKGIKRAGELIGILERLLVFTFIVSGEWGAVGFLLTAKSVFRFGDLKDSSEVHMTEYILIGTLLSFSAAIYAGIIAKQLVYCAVNCW